jgi:hypothetical protein
VANVPVARVILPDVSAFGAAIIARALVETAPPLNVLVREWTGGHSLISPGPDAPQYGELLERYLQPFGNHARPS